MQELADLLDEHASASGDAAAAASDGHSST